MPLPFSIDFTICDWENVAETEHAGESGAAYWKTRQYGDVRVRLIRYTPGYVAGHWCKRGHVLFVLSGDLLTELETGESFALRAGQSYAVADNASSHKSSTVKGATLFVVD